MKPTALTILFALLLFSCRNSETPAGSTTKSDTTKSALTKLIKSTSQQTDSLATMQYDSVKDDNILVAGYPIVVTTKQRMEKFLKQADSVFAYHSDEDNCIDTDYHLKASLFIYCNNSFQYFSIKDNSVRFSVNGKSIKIGDNVNVLKSVLPQSYVAQHKIGGDTSDSTLIEAYLKDSYRTLDFTINGKNKIIAIEVSSGEED